MKLAKKAPNREGANKNFLYLNPGSEILSQGLFIPLKRVKSVVEYFNIYKAVLFKTGSRKYFKISGI